MQELTEDTFEEFIGANEKAVVYFGAEWCGPCHIFRPIVDQIASEYSDMAFAKVDVDKCIGVAKRFYVMGVPAIRVFNNGIVTKHTSGAMSAVQFKQFLNN